MHMDMDKHMDTDTEWTCVGQGGGRWRQRPPGASALRRRLAPGGASSWRTVPCNVGQAGSLRLAPKVKRWRTHDALKRGSVPRRQSSMRNSMMGRGVDANHYDSF